jgi:hypothetical protein
VKGLILSSKDACSRAASIRPPYGLSTSFGRQKVPRAGLEEALAERVPHRGMVFGRIARENTCEHV